MISGGHPLTEYAIYFARIGKLSDSATDLLANKTTAAPSVI